jgi:hypothetical protein
VGTEKCPWVMPAFSPAWTLSRLGLQDKDNSQFRMAALQHRFNTYLYMLIGYKSSFRRELRVWKSLSIPGQGYGYKTDSGLDPW